MTPPPVSRRTVLAATPGLALAATPASPSEAATGTSPAAPVGVDDYPRLDTLPFAHGVASGDPTPTRVIIWTRVTLPDRDPAGPPGANPRGSRPAVRWVVATDPALTTVVASGTQTATAERDWTVKVDVTGLRPATTYYYGFRLGAQRSMTGRTRTSTSGHLGRARLAVMSCQSYWSSRWAGLGHLARRNDIDLVIHLGDYIYDFIDGNEKVRSRVGFDRMDHPDNRDWLDLHEVRRRYALWRSEPNLVRAHQQHPWSIVWDNHDIDPGYGNEIDVPGIDPSSARTTLADTMRAFHEWTPTRPVLPDGSGRWDLVDDGSYPWPKDPSLIHRHLTYGDLADVFQLDAQSGLDRYGRTPDASHLKAGEKSLLGSRQFRWLVDGLRRSQAAGTRWRIVGNQAWFTPVDLPDVVEGQPMPKIGISRWAKFPAERSAFTSALRGDAVHDRVRGTICVSGDSHGNLGADLLGAVAADGYGSGLRGGNPRDGSFPENRDAGCVRTTTGNLGAWNRRAQSVGVEFSPSSMGRGGADDAITGAGFSQKGAVGLTRVAERAIAGLAPNVQFLEWADHGYGIVDLTHTRAIFEWWWQDKHRADAPDVLGHQMVTWAKDDASTTPRRWRDQIDAVWVHGLVVRATAGTRRSAPAPDPGAIRQL